MIRRLAMASGALGRRFSPLAPIDSAAVAGLVPWWAYHSGVTATFQATPIVVDGVMFVSLPFSGVAALDATSGHEHWCYTEALGCRAAR